MINEKHNRNKKYWMYPGKWDPFHKGHKTIISNALERGKNIWITISDTETSKGNPYTAKQRLEMVKRAYGNLYGDRVIATIIPNIYEVRYGRRVRYQVGEVYINQNTKDTTVINIKKDVNNGINWKMENYINLLESTIWLTGLPCSGKTTIGNMLEEEINNRRGYKTFRLDGDVVRGKGRLNDDLGFSYDDRKENLRRIASVAKMLNDTKTTVIASFVSPKKDLRKIVKEIIGKDNLKLVYVKCPVEVCAKRDVKGMYKKAHKGVIRNFTGVSESYEEPKNPLITVNTHKQNLESCVEEILTKFDF